MRQSNRVPILDAAVRIAEARGLSGVTLDAVAEEAGLTKGGLIYHFASKDALLVGIQEHLAETWEQDLEAAAGMPVDAADARQRLVAYIHVCARGATRAELSMQLESAGDPDLNQPWVSVLARWRPVFDPNNQTAQDVSMHTAVLAAEGLWAYEMLGLGALDEDQRHGLAQKIVEGLAG